MEYFGAEDYYFWQGIKWGLEQPRRPISEVLDDELPVDMPMASQCREAASEGYIWGLVLTPAEYTDMMTVVKTKKVVQTKKKEEKTPKSDIIDHEYPFKGEC